jgi:hypothetical protein
MWFGDADRRGCGAQFVPAARATKAWSAPALGPRTSRPHRGQGPFRWAQIQANDVAHFLDEQWVLGESEGLRPMRLQGEGPPDSAYRALAPTRLTGHRASAPMGGGGRRTLQRESDYPRDVRVAYFRGAPGGAPGRGSSSRPSTPLAANRPRHLLTVQAVTPTASATAQLAFLSPQARMMGARVAQAWAVFGRRLRRSLESPAPRRESPSALALFRWA